MLISTEKRINILEGIEVTIVINLLEQKISGVKLTKVQKNIAEYFLKNQERIGNLSSLQVAKEIGVSDASIIRFSRIIGYAGFADLKHDIYNSLVFSSSSGIAGLTLSERHDARGKNLNQKKISDIFIEVMEYNLKRSFLQNKQELFDQTVQIIQNADKKFVLGFHGCKGIATQFGRLLRRLENNVNLILTSDLEVYTQLQSLTQNDAVFVFNFARYYKSDIGFVEYVKKKNAKIVVITDSVLAPYTKYADVVLLAATEQFSFFHSMIGATCIVEYLLTQLSRQSSCLERLDEIDALTEDLRIHD